MRKPYPSAHSAYARCTTGSQVHARVIAHLGLSMITRAGTVRIPAKPNAHSTLKRTLIPRLSERAFHAQANGADVAMRA
jgi:hypothetical protein